MGNDEAVLVLSLQVEIESESGTRFILKLSCLTNPQLYDHPLTIEVAIPESWATERVVITNQDGKEIDVRTMSATDGVMLRFNVRPTDAEYTIERTPHPN